MLLVYLAVAWVLGILLARLLWAQLLLGCALPPLWLWAASASCLVAVAFLMRRQRRVRIALVLILFAVLGAWRYQSHPVETCSTPADLAFYNGTETAPAWVTVEGVVDGYPDVRDRTTNYELRVHALEVEGQRIEVRGASLLQIPRYPEFQYGDELRVSGLLQTPPEYEDFSYQDYLARLSIHSLIRYPRTVELVGHDRGSRFWSALYALRSRLSQAINRTLPEPSASLLNGILLGIETGIPSQLYDDFNTTGTSHIIVISGFNITIIVALLSNSIGRIVGRRWAIYPVLAGICAYTLLVGADPPVVRAAIMGALYVWSIHLGRQDTAYVSLCAAVLLMTAINPLTLWDVGFQLSFLATLGMILFSPTIEAWFDRLSTRFLPTEFRRPVLSFLNTTLVSTLAAQILVIPLLAAVFGRLSLISLLSNLLILPVQPWIMTWGGAAALSGLAWQPLGRVLAAVVWLFTSWTVAIVEWTARWPLASVGVGAWGRLLAGVYYSLMFLLILRSMRAQLEGRPERPNATAWVAVPLLLAPLWLGVGVLRSLPDGLLHVWYIGLGEGDAALVQTPGGRRALVDIGRGQTDIASAVRSTLPGWGRRVDLVIVTQADDEHAAALNALLDGLRVELALVLQGAASDYARGGADSPESGVPLIAPLAGGMRIPIDDAVLLEVLHAPDGVSEPDSAVLRLTMGEFRMLLPSEIEQHTQARLLANGGDLSSTALKAPQAGTGNWPTAPFLSAVQPQLLIVPGGTTYPPATLEAIGRLNRLSADPWEIVELISDGQKLWIKRHRPADLTIR